MVTPIIDFNGRRKSLRMPIEALVRRSRVPRPTVFRILRGRIESVRFGYVQSVAESLGLPLGAPGVDAEEYRLLEATRKAKELRRLTQGTMGLEAQAVGDDALLEIERWAITELLTGNGRKLWSD